LLLLGRRLFIVTFPIGLLLHSAATITPRNENLHPNIPRDAEEPNSQSSPKVYIVDHHNQPDWISSQCGLGEQPV
jgi:hypothetical protein